MELLPRELFGLFGLARARRQFVPGELRDQGEEVFRVLVRQQSFRRHDVLHDNGTENSTVGLSSVQYGSGTR